jgi:hypothetical protein
LLTRATTTREVFPSEHDALEEPLVVYLLQERTIPLGRIAIFSLVEEGASKLGGNDLIL